MTDKPTHRDRLKGILHQEGKAAPPLKEEAEEEGEASCGAFGYLRGLRDQSAAESRKKRPPREGKPDVGALHVHLTSTGRTPTVGRRQ